MEKRFIFAVFRSCFYILKHGRFSGQELGPRFEARPADLVGLLPCTIALLLRVLVAPADAADGEARDASAAGVLGGLRLGDGAPLHTARFASMTVFNAVSAAAAAAAAAVGGDGETEAEGAHVGLLLDVGVQCLLMVFTQMQRAGPELIQAGQDAFAVAATGFRAVRVAIASQNLPVISVG